MFFFFQAEDGIRDAQESRGLGDVYKRQLLRGAGQVEKELYGGEPLTTNNRMELTAVIEALQLSLIHI